MSMSIVSHSFFSQDFGHLTCGFRPWILFPDCCCRLLLVGLVGHHYAWLLIFLSTKGIDILQTLVLVLLLNFT